MSDFKQLLKDSVDRENLNEMSATQWKIGALKLVKKESSFFKDMDLKKFVNALKKKMKGLPHDVAEDVYKIAVA